MPEHHWPEEVMDLSQCFLARVGMGATQNNGPCRAIVLCIFCYSGIVNLGLPWLQPESSRILPFPNTCQTQRQY